MSAGYANLSDFDFTEALAGISNAGFLYYKEQLYSPEDFKQGSVQTKPIALSDGRVDPGNFGTYRILVALGASEGTYGLSAYSAMYAQRLFIDGREYPAIGTVGDTADATVPMTNHYTVYFTPKAETVEIIIQFANFSHYDYGGIMPIYLGSQQMITARDAMAQQRVHILIGCAMTVFLFFLGLFIFFRRRFSFLWFSIFCMAIGVRLLSLEEKALMLLFPALPWRIAIGLEYLALIALFLSFILYINSIFTGALHKNYIRGYSALCAAYTLTILLTPPALYTRFMLPFEIISGLFGVYLVVALVLNTTRKKDNRNVEHLLIFAGSLLFIIMSILDIQLRRSTAYNRPLGLSGIGMIVLMFAGMVALVLQFSHTEAELENVRRYEGEMQEYNRLLDRMSRMKSDFMTNISHEMRTPLTVMANYAGLTSLEIRRNAVNEKTLENLQVIKREAIRLADLVEQLKTVSLERDRELTLADVSAASLLQRVAEFCNPICRRNGNRITVSSDVGDVLLRVNPDSIFQTLINLVINANRHSRHDTIHLCIQPEADYAFAMVSVADNGEGVEPELLPRLFERGVSGDGGSGLGLSICKEIVEEHGGRIWIASDKGKGTVVTFTLPISKGGPAENEKATILIVEDDRDIANANRAALELEGYAVLVAETLAKGRSTADEFYPDLIILDVLLPDGNGLSYCEELRGKSGVRILFLSALNTRSDVLAGLRAGGDDYMSKPYDMDELLLRAEALLRRGRLAGHEELTLRLGELELDFNAHRALLKGSDIMLKPKEFALLAALAREPGKTLSADELYKKVWGMDMVGDSRTVKEHISRIRSKLGKGFTFTINSERGKGYRLESCRPNP